jgi:hypothetical protein
MQLRASQWRQVLAALLCAVFLLSTRTALAQDAQQDAQARSECARHLKAAEAALASDARYVQAWKQTWIFVGVGASALSVAGAFYYTDYRRSEQIVYAVESLFIATPTPITLTLPEMYRGIHAAGLLDPCLALNDVKYAMEMQDIDAEEHTSALSHSIAFAVPILSSVIVGLAVQHWDFAGHGSEGLQTLVGIGINEAQLLSYPHGAFRAHGTSLQLSF